MHQSKVSSGRGRKRDAKSSGYSKGDAKREEILVGLMNALAKGELRNPPLRAIGQALGVEPAHILYYFDSREDLMQAVIVRWDEGMVAEREGEFGLDTYADAVAKNVSQRGLMHLYLAFAAEAVEPAHPAHDFIRLRFDRVRDSLAAAIRREQAEGIIAKAIDPDVEARLLIALADGLQLQSLIDPDIDALRHVQTAIGQLRAGDLNGT